MGNQPTLNLVLQNLPKVLEAIKDLVPKDVPVVAVSKDVGMSMFSGSWWICSFFLDQTWCVFYHEKKGGCSM
jgi:hypothetical protein